MTVAKFSNPQQRSMRLACLLLLLVSSALANTVYPTIYIPVGAGIPQTGRKFDEPFGDYSSQFNYCGKYTTDKLNEQFKLKNVATSHDIVVQCNPTPTRVIVSVKGNQDFGQFPIDLTKECEQFTCSNLDYPQAGQSYGVITNGPPDSTGEAQNPPNPDFTVCNGKLMDTGADKGNVLFSNEGNCRKEFPNLEKTLSVPDRFVQLPRWLQKDESRVNLRTMFYKGEKVNHFERVPYTFVPSSDKKGAAYQTCNTACDIGSVVKLTMNPGAYSMMIYVKGSCTSMKVCFNPDGFLDDNVVPTCHPDRQVDIMISNGVVVWAKNGRASLIELKDEFHDDAHPVPIEFGYGVKKGNDVQSEFYIGNDHREFVTSDSKGYKAADAANVAIIFPDDKCLVPTAGVFSKHIQTGKTLSTEKPKVVGDNYNQKGAAITGPQLNNATTTTAEPRFDIPQTTTAAPVRAVPDALRAGLLDSNTGSLATYVQGKWWTWGLYLGFIFGTLLTLALGGGLFYLIRRTVFGVWYRGMYKRYGCDVSGATGGLTGVGFGDTTAMTQTIGATTGAGMTTDMGLTSTKTEATEASSTTSMLDKTEKTESSTLAM